MNFPGYGLLAAFASLIGTTLFASPSAAQPCERQEFERTKYIVCTLEPGNEGLQLFATSKDGKPYRSFSRLASAVTEQGKTLTFAINAGMYLPDYAPMGLFIRDGEEIAPANTSDGDGKTRPVPNFYKKPNGVFFIDENGAGVSTTEDFLAREPQKVRLATQSGPMLVIDNAFHPAFIIGSKDRTRRSGVGVSETGAIRFAISEDDVNFHDFARMFRDHLKCANALFLDGGQGAGLYNPGLRRNDWSWHGGYGPMLGLVE